jgi:hypothetical protein
MNEKLGIDNLKVLFKELALIVEDGYNTFKDGVQIWDVTFIPKALKRIVMIAKVFPMALKESKDLQIEEVAELVGDLVNTILGIFDKYKKK